MNNRKRMLLAVIQPTPGLDPVPVVGTDAVLCGEIEITPMAADYQERNIVRPSFGSVQKIPTGIHVTLDFQVELAGMMGLGVPTPGLDALLRCCAASQNVVPVTSTEYLPVDSAYELATLYFSIDNVLHRLTDARGNAVLSLSANKLPSIKFSIVGLFNPVVDIVPGVPDYSNFQLPVEVNSTNTTAISLHGFSTGVLASLEIDLGTQVKYRDFPGGTKEIRVQDRQSTGSISLEATDMATRDWFTTIQDSTLGPLSITHGPAGNRVILAAPSVQLTEPKYGDSDGITTIDMNLTLLPVAGNDEWSMMFL